MLIQALTGNWKKRRDIEKRDERERERGDVIERIHYHDEYER